MQNDYTKVVEQVLQCECCLACLVTMNILDADKAFLRTIERVAWVVFLMTTKERI